LLTPLDHVDQGLDLGLELDNLLGRGPCGARDDEQGGEEKCTQKGGMKPESGDAELGNSGHILLTIFFF